MGVWKCLWSVYVVSRTGREETKPLHRVTECRTVSPHLHSPLRMLPTRETFGLRPEFFKEVILALG